MLDFVKNTNKRFGKNINRYPKWVYRSYFSMMNVVRHFYYSQERRRIAGRLEPRSDRQSVVFFSAHKCASTYVNGILTRVLKRDQLIPINFSGYVKGDDAQARLYNDPGFLEKAFESNGFFYGAFRYFVDIPALGNYKVLLVLRDPRDVLTSHYFSTAFNHPVMGEKFLKKRERALGQTIDDYVLEKLPLFRERYVRYIDELLGKEFVHFTKYEDMISDFPRWLHGVADYLGVSRDEPVLEKLIAEADFEVSENPNQFKRNVKAGDHLRKLEPETVQVLNRELSPILEALGYS